MLIHLHTQQQQQHSQQLSVCVCVCLCLILIHAKTAANLTDGPGMLGCILSSSICGILPVCSTLTSHFSVHSSQFSLPISSPRPLLSTALLPSLYIYSQLPIHCYARRQTERAVQLILLPILKINKLAASARLQAGTSKSARVKNARLEDTSHIQQRRRKKARAQIICCI